MKGLSMSKLKIILKRSFLGALVVALTGLAAWSWSLKADNGRLKRDNQDQSAKLTAQGKQISDLTRSEADEKSAAKQLQDALRPIQEENQTLKTNIGAFATQAASCEKVKQKLNYKG